MFVEACRRVMALSFSSKPVVLSLDDTFRIKLARVFVEVSNVGTITSCGGARPWTEDETNEPKTDEVAMLQAHNRVRSDLSQVPRRPRRISIGVICMLALRCKV